LEKKDALLLPYVGEVEPGMILRMSEAELLWGPENKE
jgi:hypothetical protein